MVVPPRLIPAKSKAKTFAGVTYHVGTEVVPVLTVEVGKSSVYFEHHCLLWKHPAVQVTPKDMGDAAKRTVGGGAMVIAEAHGEGMVAVSRDGPGRMLALHLTLGREIRVREHQFVAATDKVVYSYAKVNGPTNLSGAQGYFVDTFASSRGDGVLWIYAYGAVFEIKLAEGESIDIDPGAWLYRDGAIRMETVSDRLAPGRFGAHTDLTLIRFTGPGRIGVQSMNAPRLEKV